MAITITRELEFRPYSLYASRDLIEKKLNEGYNEVAFSYEGRWPRKSKSNERVARMCVFFSSNGKIEIYEHCEFVDGTIICALKPFPIELRDDKELRERLKWKKIGLGERRRTKDVLQDIIGWEYR